MKRHFLSAVLVSAALMSAAALAQSKDATATLGTVHLNRAVMANGQPLAAGTYQVRLVSDPLKPVVGESPDGEQWVEFARGGTVAGREVASVISAADITSIAKGPRPAAGAPRVEQLQGGEYVRVWIVKGGTTYLIHLRSAAK